MSETLSPLAETPCSLTWCDGCMNRRPCVTLESGIIYEGKDCPIHLCRWCRGYRSRRINAANSPLGQTHATNP